MSMSIKILMYAYVCVWMSVCVYDILMFHWPRPGATNMKDFSGDWDKGLTWAKDISFETCNK